MKLTTSFEIITKEVLLLRFYKQYSFNGSWVIEKWNVNFVFNAFDTNCTASILYSLIIILGRTTYFAGLYMPTVKQTRQHWTISFVYSTLFRSLLSASVNLRLALREFII